MSKPTEYGVVLVQVAVIELEASTFDTRTPCEPKASAPALIVQLADIVTETVKVVVAVAASAALQGPMPALATNPATPATAARYQNRLNA